jgi:hypothetical protein
VGLPVVGRLIGIIGPLDKYATVSKLWAFCGLSVNPDGTTQKRTKGETVNYSPQVRVILHRLGDSVVKMGKGGTYRAAYDYKKAVYLARPRLGNSGCPMGRIHKDAKGRVYPCIHEEDGKEVSAHLHTAAMRYAVKTFLKHFWKEWNKRRNENET